MSLYRTYRPQTFADVIGQDHIVTTLEQALKQDKLAHAYLFAGTRGTGKTSVARILAKAIMTKGITNEVIEKQIIKGVEEGSIVDLLEIDAASNRGIDDIRDLIEKIQFSPVVASAKVYIIDEVHMLTKEAFNALLKTLEEPPPYAYFILATTELNKIPVTIQSRCQSFPFRQIREEDIIRRLQFIVDSEKIEIDREALRAIAAHVQGGMRDAISLLDQLRSLAKITADDVHQRVGTSSHEQVNVILEAIDVGDSQAIVAAIREIEEAGTALDVFLRQLLETIRQQLHEAASSQQPIDRLVAMMDTLLAAIRDVRIAPVPGLVVETALLSLSSHSIESPEEKPKPKDQKPKVVEKTDSNEAPNEPKQSAKQPLSENESTKPEESNDEIVDATVEATEATIENLNAAWSEILKAVEPASVRMSLKDGQVTSIDGNTITIGFASAFHRDKVATTDASRAVEDVIEKIFKQHLKIECEIQKASGTSGGQADDAVNLAEAAAEIF